jgi:NAD+-dependent secondary alcohol dehydrogenase Adh1
MKAARLHEFHAPLVVEDVPDPEIRSPLDVIVRIGAAGLCRTDLHIWEGQFDEAQKEAHLSLPYSPGHENAGWVEAVGDAVTNVAPGDKVILHPLVTCGLCRACRDGDDVHCENSAFPGLFAEGGFAQYLRTGARSVVKLDPSLEPVDVAPLADAGLTAYHAVRKAVPLLYPGTTVAVIGAGGLGHIGIQCLKAMVPARIIVLDVNEEALSLARGWGADHAVMVDGDQVAAVMDHTGGRGADVVIDFVGESGAEQWGVDLLRRAGSFFVVGYGGTLQVPTMRIILTEINFIGNLVGSYNDLVELMTLAAQGKVRLHTTTYRLDEINVAIDALAKGRLRGRGILVP